jgi:hypothetical protein
MKITAHPNYVVCPSSDESGFILSGGIKTYCVLCGRPIWMAPKSMAFMANTYNCTAVCSSCAAEQGRVASLKYMGGL